MKITSLFGFIGILGASVAQAALIAPGTSVVALAEVGPVGGSLVGNMSTPFAGAGFTGTLTTQVFSGDASNPLGGLTFTYSIAANANNTHNLTRFTVNGFAGYLTDMSYTAGSGTVAATLNDRDAGGDVVGYRYIGSPLGFGTIAAGATTNLMVVQTNAAAFVPSIAAIINGSTASASTLAPRAVPEPVSATSALLAAGLIRRRR